jgi:flagellar protein FliL
MAANPPEAAAPANGAPEAAPAASGGIKAWLPLILNVVLMPVLAYVMTMYVLLPKMRADGIVVASAHGEEGGEHGKGSEKEKVTVPLSDKVLVNVSGTMGTRYLLAKITLVGSKPALKEMVEKNDAQLRDVASSVLNGKTISDLDKPGARNLIRTELVSSFNNVLGNGAVNEIFFTEFAIQ